jgi:hypothetical protein
MKKIAVSRVGHSEKALGDFRLVDQAGTANSLPTKSSCPRMLNHCPVMSKSIEVRPRQDSRINGERPCRRHI